MSERAKQQQQRRPATFRLDDPSVVMVNDGIEAARPARPPGAATVQIAAEAEPAPLLPVAVEAQAATARRSMPWGSIFFGAVGGLVLMALGLGVIHLVEDLYARNELLGLISGGFAGAATVALLVMLVREAYGLARLATIEKLHRRAAEVLVSDDRAASRAVVTDLLKIAHQNPQLAQARAALTSHSSDIIDGADMIRLAERELLTPLDVEARRLVSAAAQRVSIVTAVSPRAIIDILFVAVAALRLIRQLAHLYGGRPGALGMISLFRQVITHLAITGGMAASDGLVQQVLGHGIAAKLSHKLGEGVLNGLLTARLGLAAIDVTRPLPFMALPRPALPDLAKDLLRKRESEE